MKQVLESGFNMPRYIVRLPILKPARSFVYYWTNFATFTYMLCFQLPEEARELDKEVRQIVKEKEEFVRNQDFEKVNML